MGRMGRKERGRTEEAGERKEEREMVVNGFPGRTNSICKDSEFRKLHIMFEKVKND